jgi:hypothetical protein
MMIPLQGFQLVHDLILIMDELSIYLIQLMSYECDWILDCVG